MSEMRMLILSEDYGESVLILSDLENTQLNAILRQLNEDLENGIGRTTEDIAKEMFSNCEHYELGDTYSSKFDRITELDYEIVTEFSCYSFSVVKSER